MTAASGLRFLLVAALGGVSFPMVKVSLEGLGPAQLVFGRLVLGAVVLLALARLRGTGLPRFGPVWGHLVVAALLGNVLPFTLLSHGERTTGAGIAGVLVGSTPLLTLALTAAASAAEPATRRRVTGLVVGFLGLVVVIGPWHTAFGSIGGQLACLGAASSYAAYFSYMRTYLSPRGHAPVSLIAGQLSVATVVQAPLALFPGGAAPHLTGRVVISTMILGLLCTGLGYVQLFRLIGEVGATTASAVNYLEPVFAVLLSIVLFGEPVRFTMLVGGLVLFAGMAHAEQRISTPRRFCAVGRAGKAARKPWAAVVDDLDVIRERDPSIASRTEALLHPALPAIWTHRVAHRLHRRGLRRTARLLSALARVLCGGVDIHPGARIGRGFFIDHGTGVVIGETAVIGDDVTIFHQVTLGSAGWWHDRERPAGARRHPTVGDRVVIGANATVLGPITVGHDTVIGAQALVIQDVPSGSRVLAPAAEHHRPRPRRATDVVVNRDSGPLIGFPTW